MALDTLKTGSRRALARSTSALAAAAGRLTRPRVDPVTGQPTRGGLPLLGEALELRRDMLGFVARRSRQGPAAPFRVFGYRMYLLNRPELIEAMLVHTNDKDLAKTPGDGISRLLLGKGLVTSQGELWLRQRRLMQPAFHRRRIAGYAATMAAEAEGLADSWGAGGRRDLLDDMMGLTLNIATRTLFSADVRDDAREVGAAFGVVMRVFAQMMAAVVPAPAWLPTRANRAYRAALARLDAIIYRIIAERRAAGGEADDLLGMLLAAQDEDGGRMSDQQVRDEVMTLFLAGHETTALALTWAFALLATNPAARERLEAELDEVLAGRVPGFEDVPRLRYTEQVLREAMRLYPPAWLVDARVALRDLTLAGLRFPKGSYLVASQWGMHRDPAYFPEPERFRPERWDAALTRGLPRYAYFPFGGGGRICIGQSFAQMEATLALATLARRYRADLPAGQGMPAVSPSMTLRPAGGLPLIVTPR